MFRNNLKIALRNLNRKKGYAAINVLGLALGLACSILIFTVVKYHLSFDTFHNNADRIYRIISQFHGPEGEGQNPGVPNPLAKAFRTDYTYAEKVARVVTFDNQLITITSDKEVRKFQEEEGVAFAEAEFFDIFNFPLLQGDKKTALGAPNSVIITKRLADKFFDDKNVIGKTIKLDNRIDLTITGVLQDLPQNTDRRAEIYIANETIGDFQEWFGKENTWGGIYSEVHCFILLKKGVKTAQVEKAFPDFVKKYHGADEAAQRGYGLQPIADMHFNPELNGYVEKRNLWALSFIGLFLIITACVNFINLATAQALNRAKEVGVRKVLGSRPAQLFWQFIAETAVITTFSVVMAYLLAQLAMPFVNSLFETNLTISLLKDTQLLVFLLITTVAVVFFAGSYPGLVIAGFRPALALKSKITQQHVGGFSLRRVLVVTQFAISQALIIGTIVIASQMNYSKETDLGFNKDAVVMLPVPTGELPRMSTLRSELSRTAGVEEVSFCLQAPASNSNNTGNLRYDNRAEDEDFSVNYKFADNHYLAAFDLKLVAGRNIIQSDTIREVVVNEELVKRLNVKNPQEVINKILRVQGSNALVVGVVKDFYTYSFRENIDPVCIMSRYTDYNNCAVKINLANVKNVLSGLENSWNQVFPEYVYDQQFLDERVAEFYELDDIMLKLIQAFAGIAIFIGCLGLYGLVSFMAVQKTKEIGVRKVLGASVGNILWLFGKEFSRLILIAFAIAAPIAWYVMNGWLQDFEYRIQLGAGIFVAAILGTLTVAALTVGYQSIKSALTNPVESLKSE
jgi:putative ABC transport system permease protein